jgi:hypothetical protein
MAKKRAVLPVMMMMINYQLLEKDCHHGVSHSSSVRDSVLLFEMRMKPGRYLQIVIRDSKGHSSCYETLWIPQPQAIIPRSKSVSIKTDLLLREWGRAVA